MLGRLLEKLKSFGVQAKRFFDVGPAIVEQRALIGEFVNQLVAQEGALRRFAAGWFAAFDGSFHFVNQAAMGSDPQRVAPLPANLIGSGLVPVVRLLLALQF